MGPIIYIDGKIYTEREEAKVSVYDHGFLYGDGIFEGIRVYNNNIFKLDEHIVRFYDSAKVLCIEIPMTPEKLKDAIRECVKKSGYKDCYIRPIVTRGFGDLGLDPRKCKKATTIIIVDSIQLYPAELYENGIPVITVPTIRMPTHALNPRIKSLNYLNNVMGKIEGNNGGVLEVIMLNAEGYVAECSADNIFLVKNGHLYTPPDSAGILRGITRDTIIELAREIKLPVTDEKSITRYELMTADEVFLCGSGAELMPITTVDGRKIGQDGGKPGPIYRKLREKYKALTGMA